MSVQKISNTNTSKNDSGNSKPLQPEKVDESVFTSKTTKLDDWMQECAESIRDVNPETGELIYSKDVKDFDVTGDKYRETGDKKAYADAMLELGSTEVKAYDKDGDSKYNLQEEVEKETSDYEKALGRHLSTYEKANIQKQSKNIFPILDLDNDGNVTAKEYTSFLAATDENTDGKISRDEYAKSTLFLEQGADSPIAEVFKDSMLAKQAELFPDSNKEK